MLPLNRFNLQIFIRNMNQSVVSFRLNRQTRVKRMIRKVIMLVRFNSWSRKYNQWNKTKKTSLNS